MIIDADYFYERKTNIYNILWEKKDEVVTISRGSLKSLSKEDLIYTYNYEFVNFPMEIVVASKLIGVSKIATQIFDSYEGLTNSISANSSNIDIAHPSKEEKFEGKYHTETIEDSIDMLFHSFVYNYTSILKNTKNQHYFAAVSDEIIILVNILNRYRSILKDNSKQIRVFGNIDLTKEISDLIVIMLVDFIEQRLNILTTSLNGIQFPNKTSYKDNSIYKIEWNGSQQQLCELFLELEAKGWMQEIRDGDRKKISNTITTLFDVSKTKSSKKSNSSNSFYQILKGENVKNVRTYPFIEKTGYQRSFSCIKNK